MLLPVPASRYISQLKSLNRLWSRVGATRRENDKNSLPSRLLDVFLRTWDLGFTAFGGPAVHFQILHARFVDGKGGRETWVDEQTYQELFAICQGLPGPGSTKMIFCLALLHAGFLPALLVFLIWCLPGAIGMYALSLGVQRIGESLPPIVYALLSGLNAATVGIIGLAAVQLATKAIRDNLTRLQVILGACAGVCYTSLWYFPVLMAIGGLCSVVWDGWMYHWMRRLRAKWTNRARPLQADAGETAQSIPLEQAPEHQTQGQNEFKRRRASPRPETLPQTSSDVDPTHSETAPSQEHLIRIRTGVITVALFFASFIALLVTRGQLRVPPLALDLFTNMYLAGTIIFGGGPVVIPLLRSYVVDPGWVSSRDFLIGLAIIQAFPGPNFNFAVFLGALTMRHSPHPTVFGAFLGGLGIFFPGITLAVAVQSFWKVLRQRKAVIDFLRGVNATAVGLVFTAFYRLWEIGYLTPEASSGQSLGKEPWWVVVTAVTYSASAWFHVPAPAAIAAGAVLGLCWYGAVGR